MRTAVIGAGFAGTATAVRAAETGHHVRLVEVDDQKRRLLRQGRLAFYEQGLEQAFARLHDAGQIQVTGRLDEGGPVDIVAVCVGTPSATDGSADLTQVAGAARDIGETLARWTRETAPTRPFIVLVRSTVPPGTTRTVVKATIEQVAPNAPVEVAMSPEFLREGSALADARDPSRVVIGAEGDAAYAAATAFYGDVKCPVVRTSIDGAEAVKYMSNAFLATKIAFANEMGNLAEALGLDIDELMHGVGLDPRIGVAFLDAGCGFGGSCFPKDVSALAALAKKNGEHPLILEAVLRDNEDQPLRLVRKAGQLMGGLAGKRVALLGLAFKPMTSDVRGSRAVAIHRALRAAGATVVCHDPVAGAGFRALVGSEVRLAGSVLEALSGADLAIVQTAWPEYALLEPGAFVARMRTPILIDARRALDGDRLRRAGIRYEATGVGATPRRPRRRDTEGTASTPTATAVEVQP